MLYRLRPESGRGFRYAYKDAAFAGFQKQVCEKCGRIVARLLYKEGPHRLILEGGKEYPDYLAFTGAGKQLFLLSDRAIQCLREREITGYTDAEPVTMCDEKGNPLSDAPDYWYLEITGTVDLDYAAMQLKKKRLCPICGQFDWSRQRMPAPVLNEASWDGSDLGRVAGMPGFGVCSERFRAIVFENGLKGFCFSDLKTNDE